MANQKEVERLTKIVWAKAGYRPTEGVFPIIDPDGTQRIVSHGQLEIHQSTNRLLLISGGVRAGKSQVVAMELLKEVFVDDGLVWIVGPDYVQARAEWRYMFDPLHALGFISDYSAPDKGTRYFVTTWGCRVETKSSDDTTSLASFAPHAIAGVEMGQQSYSTYEKSLERALEHDARVIMSGTFEGALSWYADLWDKWQGPNPEGGKSFSLPTWSNTYKFPGGRTDPKIVNLENGLTPELFLERVAAIPYKPSGLVFKVFDRNKHIKQLDFDPDLPIELAIDPATHTYAILAIQWKTLPGLFTTNSKGVKVSLTEVRVIDEIYEHDIIAQDIIPIVKDRPWFPHVKSGVIDVAGAHRAGATKSQVQIWAEEAGIQLRSKYTFINESIDVVKLRLREDPIAKRPLLLFDFRLRTDKDFAGRANGILAEFGLYKWPDWKEGQSTTAKPLDANNDALKALGYWLHDRFGPVVERRGGERKTKIRSYY